MAQTPSEESTPPSTVDEKTGYRTSPDHERTGWPPGVPYIVGNEACERFSYYGMKAILYVHLTSLFHALASIHSEAIAKEKATVITHLFFAGVYGFPMIGAILADRLLGKYKTIFFLSLVYCAGHGVLAFAESTLPGMYLGLALIAIGSGGIKPCVSANVGDQFGKGNWFRVRTIFQIFYFSVNFGSFFATLLIPLTRKHFGAGLAFGIPGILMFIATIIFWLGRKKYVHVPPKPGGKIGLLDTISATLMFLSFGHLFVTTEIEIPYLTQNPSIRIGALVAISFAFLGTGLYVFKVRQRIQPDPGFLTITLYAIQKCFRRKPTSEQTGEASSKMATHWFWSSAVDRFGEKATEGPVAVLKIISLFFMVSVFWALFDQHSSTWIRQAQSMNLNVMGFKFIPSQTAALNPGMVMLLIPFMNWVYGRFDKMGLRTTPLRRMSVGMFMASLSFVSVAIIQMRVDALASSGKQVSVLWQLIPYFLMTVSEVMVSITGLEFAYTQAPKAMKSTIMGFWLLTVSLGNVLVAFVAGFKSLPLQNFFWLFAGLMAAAGLIFSLRAAFYVPKDYQQD